MLELIDDLSSNPLISALGDDWVFYHGTSESYSASIETHGLGHPDGTPDYWDDVQSFISYWRVFHLWSPAFWALVSFSQAHHGIRPVSLGETFGRAARYAKDEPGGETIGLMARSFGEISDLINNPEVPRKDLQEKRVHLHQFAMRAGFDSEEAWDAMNGATGDSFGEIDYALNILKDPSLLLSELDRFSSYSGVGEHAAVVYAVRILSEDISLLASDRAGINYRGVFPPERLLARVRVADDREIWPRGPADPNYDSWLEAWRMWGKRLRR